MEPVDLIEKVADGFESGRYGWVKGESSNANLTAFCVAGALGYECEMNAERKERWRLESATSRIIHESLSTEGWQTIPHWNDNVNRTKEQVIDKLKEIAKDLRNQS